MIKECCDTNDDAQAKKIDKSGEAGRIELALIGNPNAGKSTLFNQLTGARQTTGNWPGVTVDRKEGGFELQDKTFHIVDLPGTYSLDAADTSTDERIARDFVQQYPNHLYINIIDASTLQRGLYLSVQLREQGVPCIILLNMMDVADKRGIKFDLAQLEAEMQCPVISVSLRKDKGLFQLKDAILNYDYAAVVPVDVGYAEVVCAAIKSIVATEKVTRAKALELLQSPSSHKENGVIDSSSIADYRNTIENVTDESLDFLLADARFDRANTLSQGVIKEQGKVSRTYSDKIDRWALGTWTGLPIFLGLMYLLFLFSINFGGAFIDFFDLGVQALLIDGGRAVLSSVGSPEWLTTILADGIGGGIQVVATFIPIIGALFLFLTLLEESGYMARAAFVMDHLMRKVGVSGKAFVPLVIGFGCNVPGIMAARTLSSHRERIISVMMTPFMSCGARLAVYALFAAAFFPVGGQNIVFLLYLIGILFAILTALLLKKTVLKGEVDDFFMELPTYHIPALKNVLINTWNKLKSFVLGAGKIIVIVVALINVINSWGVDGSFGNQNSENSVLSATAKVVTPIFQPMGLEKDNWPATVGIMTGLLAKEVVVGTLDALYSELESTTTEANIEEDFNLLQGLSDAVATIPSNLADAAANLTDPLGLGAIEDVELPATAAAAQEVDVATFGAMVSRFDGKIGAFAYLLFILLYFPCMAATGAMVREVGRDWALVGVLWTTGLAYTVSVIFYQLATFSRHPMQSLSWTIGLLVLLAFAVFLFAQAGKAKESVAQQLSGEV